MKKKIEKKKGFVVVAKGLGDGANPVTTDPKVLELWLTIGIMTHYCTTTN